MSSNSETRTSNRTGTIIFALVQVAFLVAVGVALAHRVGERRKMHLLPTPHNEPTVIAPTYNYPWVVSDEQLQLVLHKLRPRLTERKPNIGHIDHALRFWGVEAKFAQRDSLSGEEMRDILLNHERFTRAWDKDAPPLITIEKTGAKVRTQEGKSSTSHVDHVLAALAEVGTKLDHPVVTADGETNMRALLEYAMRDFSLNQVEYEWSTLAFALYIAPQRSWITSEGQHVSFDLLADRIMRQPYPQGVCYGNHRLHTLTVLLRLDEQSTILEKETRARILNHLSEATRRLVKNQSAAGYWDGNWSAVETKTGADAPAEGTLGNRILATGHALEWWSVAPTEVHPPRETLIRAGQWLAQTVGEMDDATVKKNYTFLTHAGRALALWRGDFPAKLYKPQTSTIKKVIESSASL